MSNSSSVKTQTLTTNDWRLRPGYLCEGGSDFESVHILLGRFLADRHSDDPLPDVSMTMENAGFEWGKGLPLEKVINSQDDLEFLMKHPNLFRNAIAVIEPWDTSGAITLVKRYGLR